MKNWQFLGIIVLSICALGMRGTVKSQPTTVIVPNVEGIKMDVATQILRRIGLQPRIQGSSSSSALVARQDPRPGFSVFMGEAVILSSETTGRVSRKILDSNPQRDTSSVSLQPGRYPGGASTQNVAGPTIRQTGTGVSVTPLRTLRQDTQILVSPGLQEGQSQVLYQQPQAPISPYFAAETEPRFYPAWYPKRFLPQNVSQSSVTQVQPDNIRISVQPAWPQSVSQPSFSPSDTEPQSYLQWYPKEFLRQKSSQEVGVYIQSTQQQQGINVFQTSTTPSVPVPNLSRLRQQDAIAAIYKAGLSIGNILLGQSSQGRPGLIEKQSPRARAIVPAGTKVDLWLTR